MEHYLAFGGVVSEVSLILISKLDPPGDIYTGALGVSSVADARIQYIPKSWLGTEHVHSRLSFIPERGKSPSSTILIHW